MFSTIPPRGGHPYLTGLAVGGGIYWWGCEGAILGPLMLCSLLTATRLYAALIRPPPQSVASVAAMARMQQIARWVFFF